MKKNYELTSIMKRKSISMKKKSKIRAQKCGTVQC